jgi:SAM-dependent methyltransferase
MTKRQGKDWHDDDEFWETFGPTMFGQKQWEEAPKEVDELISLLDIQPGSVILDLCCGPGRHSLELARRGFRVTGVDRTASYLLEAKKRAKAEGLNIEFIQEDMRKFSRAEGFDVIINMFTAFGYFEDSAEDKSVLSNIYLSLRKGGKLIIDIISKEILARIFRERDWQERNKSFVLQERKVVQNWSRMENRWILLKDGRRYETRFSHRLYSAVELSGLLTDSGFSCVNIYGDLTGAEYDHNAKRLIAVAKK